MTEEIVGMSLEDIEAVASGSAFMNAEQPQQERGQEQTDEPQPDDGESEQVDDGSTEDNDSEQEQEQESAEVTDDSKPRMNRKSERVKEAVDRANAAERRLQELEFKFQQQMNANQKLMEMITGGDKQDAPAADEEILDEALARKMEERFGKLEDRQASAVKAQELAYIGGEQGEVYQKAIAASAVNIMRKASGLGQNIDMTKAESLARQAIEGEIKEMAKRGAQPGAIAQELANAASYFDYLMSQTQQKPAGQKTTTGVNMKKVEEARQKAGAPTIDKASVNISGGMNVYQSELKKVKESAGLSDDYIRKLGFS